MGAGKTTVGRLVAEAEGVDFRDLDQAIEHASGMTVPAMFESRGEAAFRAWERRLLPGLLAPGLVVSVGGGAIADDSSWTLLKAQGFTVWLDASLETLLERAAAEMRPLLRGRSPAAARALYERRRARYAEAEARVDAGGAPDAVAAEVRRLWAG